MTTQAVLADSNHNLGTALAWMVIAAVLGSIAALVGLPVFYGLIAGSLVVIFAAMVVRYSPETMVVSVWTLALCPFSIGIETGVLPKLFADEILLLLYLAVILPLIWTNNRVWQQGAAKYYWVLILFALCQSLSILVRTDLIAARNLLETSILGPMLLVVFLQEVANSDRDELFANAAVWLTVVLACLSVIERVVQRNPILERMELEGFIYLSPRIVAITEGVYRPYVTFFHPSETGTFMAMGLPFAIRAWRQSGRWISALQILLIVFGILVNATRGVWVAVAISLLLLAKKPIRILLYSVPTAALVGMAAFLGLRATPFMQRLTDLNNLLGRFIYWQLGIEVFADHMLLGVGHMQFQNVYLDYIQDLSELAQIDLKQVYVIDNIYLTTLVEHGIIGLAGMLVLFIFTAVMLRKLRTTLSAYGLNREASLVQVGQLVLVIYAAAGFFADVSQFTKATKFFFILIGFSLGVAFRSIQQAENAKSHNLHGSPSLEHVQ